jgi:hypothetical protein
MSHAYEVDGDGVIHYDPVWERLEHTVDYASQKLSAQSVVIKEVPIDKVAENVVKQLTSTIDQCMGGDKDENLKKIKFYRYVSDYHRNHQLPPSFLADIRSLYYAPKKFCPTSNLCDEKAGCSLLGYNAKSDETWLLQTSPKMFSWNAQIVKDPKNGTVTYLQTVVNQDCGSDVQAETGCTKNYIWGPQGFVPYTLPAVTAEEPAATAVTPVTDTAPVPKAKEINDDAQ